MRFLALFAVIAVGLWPSASTEARHAADISEGPACVRFVIDGNTVEISGLDHPLRLAGSTAFPLSDPIGNRAREVLSQYFSETGCQAWLEPASPSFDPGIQLYRAHIWIESPVWGWFLAEEGLIAEGLALLNYEPYGIDDHYAHYLGAQQFARQSDKGIWLRVKQGG